MDPLPKAEMTATETTVPGRIKGAMMARSKMRAPLGLRRSVMYATRQPSTAQSRDAVVERYSELRIGLPAISGIRA